VDDQTLHGDPSSFLFISQFLVWSTGLSPQCHSSFACFKDFPVKNSIHFKPEPRSFFQFVLVLILLKHKIGNPNSRFLLMVATAFSLWYTGLIPMEMKDIIQKPEGASMNFLHLKYFLLVAEELNITRAAERLFISQQSLSNHISNMEKELDVKLFTRSPKLSLTYAGDLLVETATQI